MSKEKTTHPETTDDEVQAQTEAGHADAHAPGTASNESAPVEDPAEAPEEETLSELDQAKAEAAEMKQRYLRSVADLENYRKRIAREKQEIIRSAAANVIESLLPVLDNLKLGLQAARNHEEAKDVVTGFEMVENQLRNTLVEQGLEELAPTGEKFDPNLHECIAHQPSDEVPEDHVIKTVRSGYRLNDRLIRAANVIVSSGEGENGAAENQED